MTEAELRALVGEPTEAELEHERRVENATMRALLTSDADIRRIASADLKHLVAMRSDRVRQALQRQVMA